MKRCAIALTLLVVWSAGVRADVTVTNTLTFAGPMAAMMNGANQMVMRIKGTHARMDMEMMGQRMSTLMDMETKQVTILQHAQKTAQLVDMSQALAKAGVSGQMPKIDAKVDPTGNTMEINGQKCSEYKYSMTLDMAAMMANMAASGAGPGGQPMPPGAADMFKDLKMIMNGTMWVAKDGPGVSEYVKFSKAAQGNMMPMSPFGGAGMTGAPGMEEMMKAFSKLDGMAYQTEIEMSFEGTSPMIDMVKAMGAMKISTKVTEVSTQPIADDQFQVPADYTVTKQ